MPQTVFPLDSTKRFTDQQLLGHNRWHPDIPAAVPHLAARLWLEMSFEPSAQEFLSNPWAIQIHLDQAGRYNTRC